MVIFLAALQTVPRELYEAAAVDGARPWARFRAVSLPAIRPVIAFVVVLLVIGGFNVFISVLLMTNGGPINETQVLLLYMYQQAFSYLDFGYGSAIAFTLTLVVFALSLVQLRLFRRPPRPASSGRRQPRTCARGARRPPRRALARRRRDDPPVRVHGRDLVQVERARPADPAAAPSASPTIANYTGAWSSNDFGRYFVNSLLVAIATTVLAVWLSSMMAYSFARFRFPGQRLLFGLLLIGLMVPTMMLIIPQFLLAKQLGMLDSLTGLVFFYTGGNLALNTFLLRSFFQDIPRELEEAMVVDGAGPWKRYLRLILPLSRPALATVSIFTFLASWDEFVWALTIINNPSKRTLPIAIALFQGEHSTAWGLVFAASTIAIVPVVARLRRVPAAVRERPGRRSAEGLMAITAGDRIAERSIEVLKQGRRRPARSSRARTSRPTTTPGSATARSARTRSTWSAIAWRAAAFHGWVVRSIEAHRPLAESAIARIAAGEIPPMEAMPPARYTLDGSLESAPRTSAGRTSRSTATGCGSGRSKQHLGRRGAARRRRRPSSSSPSTSRRRGGCSRTAAGRSSTTASTRDARRHVRRAAQRVAAARRRPSPPSRPSASATQLLTRFLHDGRFQRGPAGRPPRRQPALARRAVRGPSARRSRASSRPSTAVKRDLWRPGGGVYRYLGDNYFGGGEWLLLASSLAWHQTSSASAIRERLRRWVRARRTRTAISPSRSPATSQLPEMLAPWRSAGARSPRRCSGRTRCT